MVVAKVNKAEAPLNMSRAYVVSMCGNKMITRRVCFRNYQFNKRR